MSEGFVVMSRWGHKLHKVNCPCGVCISKRKKQHVSKQRASEVDKDVSSTTVPTPRQTYTVDGETAPPDTSSDPPVLAQSVQAEGQPEELDLICFAPAANGAPTLSTAPSATATTQAADTCVRRADKPLSKVLLHYRPAQLCWCCA